MLVGLIVIDRQEQTLKTSFTLLLFCCCCFFLFCSNYSPCCFLKHDLCRGDLKLAQNSFQYFLKRRF